MIKGLGAGVVGASLGLGFHLPATAQSAAALTTAIAFYRIQLGELELTVIEDGAIGFPPPFLAVNAPEEEDFSLMQAYGLSPKFAPPSVGIALIRSGEHLILMDTGTCEFANEFSGDNVGELRPTIALLGVAPEDVTDVIFSHYYPDHLGSTTLGGKAVFPNAQHYLSQIEWDYLRSGVTDVFLAPVVDFANQQLQPLVANSGQPVFYGDELVPGIQAIELPAGTDFTPMFEGLPNDACHCPHWGYVLEGAVHLKYKDGTVEVTGAGEVFYWPAGHTAWVEEDTKFMDFSPEKEFTEVIEHVARKMEQSA